jgi:hypothetical protein
MDSQKHFSLKSPSDRLTTGVRKLLREHQLVFTSKGEDEEIALFDVICKVQHMEELLMPT